MKTDTLQTLWRKTPCKDPLHSKLCFSLWILFGLLLSLKAEDFSKFEICDMTTGSRLWSNTQSAIDKYSAIQVQSGNEKLSI